MKKVAKKWISAILCMALVVGMVGGYLGTVAVAEASEEKTVYSFKEDYQTESATTGVWRYYVREAVKNVWTALEYNSTTGRWEAPSALGSAYVWKGAMYPSGSNTTNASYQTVVRFVVPKSGTITLTFPGGIKVASDSKDGVKLSFWANNTADQKFNTRQYDAGTTEIESYTMDVTEGQIFNFLLHCGGNTAGDTTQINPTITYIEKMVYSFKEDYQTTSADTGVWRYYTRDITTNAFTAMVWDATNARWKAASGEQALIWRGAMHTGGASTQTVAQFVAPKTGLVKVTVPGGITVSNSASDGVKYSFWAKNTSNQHLNNKVCAVGTTKIDAYTIEVTEGEKLNFMLHRNSNNAGDATTLNPTIEYLATWTEVSNTFSKDYSTTTAQGDVWEYATRNSSTGAITYMTYDSSNSRWSGTGGGIIANGWVHLATGTTQVALVYKAPVTGQITISVPQVKVNSTACEGAKYQVIKNNSNNDVLTAETTIAGGATATPTNVVVDVNAGDTITFLFYPKTTNTSSTTTVNPTITYNAKLINSSIEDGEAYDLTNGNVSFIYTGTGYLDGEEVESGHQITQPGVYTTKVVNQFGYPEEAEIQVYRSSDVNADNTVDIKDLVAIKKAIAGAELTSYQILAADSDGNSSITTEDLTGIRNVLLGKNDALVTSYSLVENPDNWSFAVRDNYTNTFTAMTYSETESRWKGSGSSFIKPKSGVFYPSNNFVSDATEDYIFAQFVCPNSGTVELSIPDGITLNSGITTENASIPNGVRVHVIYSTANNTNILFNEAYDGGEQRNVAFEPIELEVQAGDCIQIGLGAVSGNVAGDTTVIKPVITYKDLTRVSGTYYISSTEGDDANDGLSEGTPWKSLANLENASLGAGTQILFKSGDTFYGTQKLQLEGGELLAPITISTYGGDEKAHLYYFESENAIPEGEGHTAAIFHNANNVKISNLDFGYANMGLVINYPIGAEKQNVSIENCTFQKIFGVTQLMEKSTAYAFSSGILFNYKDSSRVRSEGDSYSVANVHISNCHATDAGSLTGYTGGVRNLYIKDCSGVGNGYYGTVITATGGIMEDCTFNANGGRDMTAGSTGLMISAKNYIVRNCSFTNQQRYGDNPDGCGIDFEWKCKNIIMDGCEISGNAGVGIMLFDSSAGVAGVNYDCIIKNCEFADNNKNAEEGLPKAHVFARRRSAARCYVEGCTYTLDDYTTAFTAEGPLNNLICNENQDVTE